MYVYNPRDFSVNYATTAGNLTGNPDISVNYIRVGSKAFSDYSGLILAGNSAALYDAGTIAYGSPLNQAWPSRSNVSIVAAGDMIASVFFAYSDKRIKTDIKPLNADKNIDKLMQLQVVDYRHIDVVQDGNNIQKGFIAQEVAKVVPEAITLETKTIPDIYAFPLSITTVEKDMVITMDKDHNLNPGDQVSLILNDGEELFTVLSCPSSKQFIVENLPADTDKIFVYGRQVKDFHVLNYDYIYTMGISVTQQLVKQVSALEEENNTLRAEQSDMKNMMQSMASRLDALEKASVQVISGEAKSSSGQ